MNKLSRFFTRNRTTWILTVLIVVACVFAIYLRLFTQKELWYETFAAVIGVIITAIITMVLLNGQSDNDARREQNAKVFEEKLRIYQEYLKTLNNVIEDGILTKEERIQLEFQTSYVAMHCKPCYIREVSEAVKAIIQLQCPKSTPSTLKSSDNRKQELLVHLFSIVGAFRKDLYGEKESGEEDFDKNDKDLSDTVTFFSEAYMNARDSDEAEENEPLPTTEQTEEATDNTDAWVAAKKSWDGQGWTVKENFARDQMIIRRKDGLKAHIGVWFGGKDGAHYYMGAGFDERLGNNDFAQPLKWECGGRIRNEWWMKVLPAEFNALEKGSLETALVKDFRFQKYITDNANLLMDVLNRYDRTLQLKDMVTGDLKNTDNWKFSIWYWDSLVCELDSNYFGTPYITTAVKDGKVSITLSNRECDRKKLQNLGLGEPDVDCVIQLYPLSKYNSLEEVAQQVIKEIEGINRKVEA